jgi:cytochrome c-type biogenesis protein CcmH/NrfG
MDANKTNAEPRTTGQAIILAVICLIVGIAGGWAIRAWQSRTLTGSAQTASVSTPAGNGASTAAQTPSPAQLRQMADAQAAPLRDILKSDPNNPGSLTSIGNIYYDAQQYPIAVDYYGRALKAKPSDAAVRTDMATAYWYMGNADEAIAEFSKTLTYAPNNPNTLFNRGLVKWQGKKDGAGAVADWEKLLATDPKYEARDKVEKMIADVKKQGAVPPGTKAN